MNRRIGIYSGTFDPVHAGHVAFALQAIERAGLDKVYFLPERRPRQKIGVEHFAHRVAMLSRAARPHQKFEVLELPDTSFNIDRTLVRLKNRFAHDKLVFLMGSDVASRLMDWPKAEVLIAGYELVVGLRSDDDQLKLEGIIRGWPVKPLSIHTFSSYAPSISSGKIREALMRQERTQGLLESVNRYADHNWLYVSVA